MRQLSIVVWLFVCVVERITEVDFLVSAHMRVESEVVWAAACTLRSRHYVSLNHSAHWHVWSIHDRHLLKFLTLGVCGKGLRAYFLSGVALSVGIKSGLLWANQECLRLRCSLSQTDVLVIHWCSFWLI